MENQPDEVIQEFWKNMQNLSEDLEGGAAYEEIEAKNEIRERLKFDESRTSDMIKQEMRRKRKRPNKKKRKRKSTYDDNMIDNMSELTNGTHVDLKLRSEMNNLERSRASSISSIQKSMPEEILKGMKVKSEAVSQKNSRSSSQNPRSGTNKLNLSTHKRKDSTFVNTSLQPQPPSMNIELPPKQAPSLIPAQPILNFEVKELTPEEVINPEEPAQPANPNPNPQPQAPQDPPAQPPYQDPYYGYYNNAYPQNGSQPAPGPNYQPPQQYSHYQEHQTYYDQYYQYPNNGPGYPAPGQYNQPGWNYYAQNEHSNAYGGPGARPQHPQNPAGYPAPSNVMAPYNNLDTNGYHGAHVQHDGNNMAAMPPNDPSLQIRQAGGEGTMNQQEAFRQLNQLNLEQNNATTEMMEGKSLLEQCKHKNLTGKLQRKLRDMGNQERIEKFRELKPHLLEVCCDPYGKYVATLFLSFSKFVFNP